tara:strand:- start:298 stop:459 length:162 start_codon:yes stop_codon:yes gene_type:complete
VKFNTPHRELFYSSHRGKEEAKTDQTDCAEEKKRKNRQRERKEAYKIMYIVVY